MIPQKILRIAIFAPLYQLFDYLLPPHFEHTPIQPGIRVKIPFGNRKLIGILLEVADTSDIPIDQLKPIDVILDDAPIITPNILSLCRWASDYYHHPLGDVFANALPALLRQGKSATYRTTPLWQLTEIGKTCSTETFKRAPKQLDLWHLLNTSEKGLTTAEMLQANITQNTILALYKKGLIDKTYSMPKTTSQTSAAPLPLNDAQQEAVDTIANHFHQFKCFVLAGITGSGKTEVYLQLIQQILDKGQQALVLIPEIALTPQTIARFRNRFPVTIVALHSGLNHSERLNAWLQAKSGEAKIIIGTRSAIFTPAENLGIIIVDEEHDLSFKQQDGFRYSARDLAITRASAKNIPIILGSATPSFETIYNSQKKRYHALYLPERAGSAIHPHYHIVDIRNKRLTNGLSKVLLTAIEDHLSQNHQVLLFLNRRGYAPTLMCHACGWIATCTRCDAHFTLHQTPPHLHCHHCDAQKKILSICPYCQNKKLQNVGVGTERLEEALQAHFPDIEVIRIDRDTTRRKEALQNLLSRVKDGRKQILVGTQMLAKGHHFPNVTLVGIINTDAGFFSADFRAAERTTQMIIQVAGRAGRAENPGEVWIQTHYPKHPLLLNLVQSGYNNFAKLALKERAESALPPFSYFALLRAESLKKDKPDDFLKEVKAIMQMIPEHKKKHIQILGPVPSPMSRRKGYFRSQLLLQTKNRALLKQLLHECLPEIKTLKSANQIRWSLDVDPMEMY